MRFQFCGNVSCPEWFIAQMSVLTKITAIKMKLIFTQLIAFYLEGQDISAKVVKLLSGTGLDFYQMNAVVSTLNFILYNSIQYHVTDAVLNKQLIDLGLPKQNVESISKTFKANRQKLLQKSLDKLPRRTNDIYRVTRNIQVEYSIHQFLGSHRLGSKSITPHKFAQLNLTHKNLTGTNENYDFIIAEDQLESLIYQLEEALAITDKIDIAK